MIRFSSLVLSAAILIAAPLSQPVIKNNPLLSKALANEEIDLENLVDPFASIDEEAVLEAYGPDGSAIALAPGFVFLERGGLAFGGALSISGNIGLGFNVNLSGDYLFDFDKASLKPEAQEALKKVLEVYEEYGGTNIKVLGHTDSKGSDEYNKKLSEQRASSVQAWFLDNGIDPKLISTTGLGETMPIAKNTIDGKDNPDCRALNRRVELTINTTKKVNNVSLANQ